MVDWLEAVAPDWLMQFDVELDELERRLALHPDIGVPIEVEGRRMRKALFRKSPYVVWYMRPDEGTVRLLRLFHGRARRPRERKPRRQS
jgi:plasmid stabilization system protein ParE